MSSSGRTFHATCGGAAGLDGESSSGLVCPVLALLIVGCSRSRATIGERPGFEQDVRTFDSLINADLPGNGKTGCDAKPSGSETFFCDSRRYARAISAGSSFVRLPKSGQQAWAHR